MAGPLKVVGGVDPHADTIHFAVITLTAKAIADQEFATTADGYRSATAFLTATGGGHGWGGRCRELRSRVHPCPEDGRDRGRQCRPPARFDRRRAGKSDRLDAFHAARAVLAGRSNPVKAPAIEGVRALHLARRSAVKAQTAAMNQLIAILVMAPDALRARYRRLHGHGWPSHSP
jgi:transposase